MKCGLWCDQDYNNFRVHFNALEQYFMWEIDNFEKHSFNFIIRILRGSVPRLLFKWQLLHVQLFQKVFGIQQFWSSGVMECTDSELLIYEQAQNRHNTHFCSTECSLSANYP